MVTSSFDRFKVASVDFVLAVLGIFLGIHSILLQGSKHTCLTPFTRHSAMSRNGIKEKHIRARNLTFYNSANQPHVLYTSWNVEFHVILEFRDDYTKFPGNFGNLEFALFNRELETISYKTYDNLTVRYRQSLETWKFNNG